MSNNSHNNKNVHIAMEYMVKTSAEHMENRALHVEDSITMEIPRHVQ